jgi:hypothetical protein
MESEARLLGHPSHQTLLALPLGAFGLAVLDDRIALLSGNPTIAGVAIPKHMRAVRIRRWHGMGKLSGRSASA